MLSKRARENGIETMLIIMITNVDYVHSFLNGEVVRNCYQNRFLHLKKAMEKWSRLGNFPPLPR